MLYFLNLESITAKFRLLKSGEYRISDGTFKSEDFFFENPIDAVNFRIGPRVVILGKEYKVDPKTTQLSEVDSVLYRKYYRIPSHMGELNCPGKRQLIEIIASGDDRTSNRVVLDVFGKYHLTNKHNHLEECCIIGKMETFPADGGYVGFEASKDQMHIDRIHKLGLRQYFNYLKHFDGIGIYQLPDLPEFILDAESKIGERIEEIEKTLEEV